MVRVEIYIQLSILLMKMHSRFYFISCMVTFMCNILLLLLHAYKLNNFHLAIVDLTVRTFHVRLVHETLIIYHVKHIFFTHVFLAIGKDY